ncbi:MAG: DUF4136 domain-containing protein [Cyclobacteriaceae bacterium]
MGRFIFISILLIGCAPRVVQFTNTAAPFASFTTFKILSLKGSNLTQTDEQSDLTPRLEQYLSDQMLRRGYTTDRLNPNLILRYELISSTESRLNNNASPYSTSRLYGNPLNNNYGGYPGFFNARTFTESILLIELWNNQSKKMIWQGSLDQKNVQNQKKRSDPIENAVVTIFNTYLYKAGSNQPDESLIQK